MRVNLSLLENMSRSVVHCTTEDDAIMFMAAMWEQYPKLVDCIWRPGQTNWNKYRENNGGIYYLPRIVHNETEISYCQSTNEATARDGRYVFVEFTDLLEEMDLGELSHDGADIKSLFGMG